MAENEEYYEPDIISVTDDDGNELLFELLERYETDNDVYVAITKYNETDEDIVDGDYEVITLKVETDDNGDEYLVEIEDEMEYEQISDILMQRLRKNLTLNILSRSSNNNLQNLPFSTTVSFSNPNTFFQGFDFFETGMQTSLIYKDVGSTK